MKTIDDYESLIRLLTESLKFYSEIDNYNTELINKDKGFQAKFALEKIEEFNKIEENILDNLKHILLKEVDQKDIEEIMKDIKTFKKISDDSV